MHIYDSVQKKKLPFEPIVPGHASIYVCGPTVYDDAHLGHAKSALVFDLLRRALTHAGFEVKFVRNITDIDDKIIKKVKETEKSLEALTTFYTQRYHEEMGALGVMAPDAEPKATESIKAIEHMILELLRKGYAYQTDDNTVYFQSNKDPKYFSLSHRHVQEDELQSRIDDTHGKRHANDFAMWKPAKDANEISFTSDLGKGRPGWHIECSAMIEAEFGSKHDYSVDIHGGGADLLFPHHENEAAQSRCATGKELAKYWMHNGFVTISGEKMSKSLGNSFFLKDALKAYHGEVLRFFLLSTHYRSDFNFNEEDLIASKKRLDRLYRLKKRVYGMKPADLKTDFQNELLEALKDDLNVSKALAILDETVSAYNEKLDVTATAKLAKKELLADLDYLEKLLGFGLADPFEYFQFGITPEEKMRIEALISARTEAKKAKDFAKADELRDELTALGISIMDTAEGTKWEKL